MFERWAQGVPERIGCLNEKSVDILTLIDAASQLADPSDVQVVSIATQPYLGWLGPTERIGFSVI